MDNSSSQRYVQGILNSQVSSKKKLEDLFKVLGIKGIISCEQKKYFCEQLDLIVYK